MKHEKKEYIDGIFNYCDRWCEKCAFTANCRLFSTESKIQTHRILNDGEYPEAKDIFDFETEEDEKTENEFDDNDLYDDDDDFESDMEEEKGENLLKNLKDEKEYPVEKLADEYFNKTQAFIKTLNENPITSDGPLDNEQEEELKHLFDNLEIISWYHMFIMVKIKRALDGKGELEIGMDELENEFESYDMNGSAKIASIAVERSQKALTGLLIILTKHSHEIEEMMVLLGKILNCLDQEFPDYKIFKRPGFDTGN